MPQPTHAHGHTYHLHTKINSVVAHTYNSSIHEEEADKSFQVQGQPGEFQDSQRYTENMYRYTEIERPYSQKSKNKCKISKSFKGGIPTCEGILSSLEEINYTWRIKSHNYCIIVLKY